MNKRPVYLNLFQLHLPSMGWVSILHRITGVLLFLGLPVSLYLLQRSLSGPDGYRGSVEWLAQPLPRLVAFILIVSLALHVFAGLRHLAMDLHCCVAIRQARQSAYLVLFATCLVALAAGWRLFL